MRAARSGEERDAALGELGLEMKDEFPTIVDIASKVWPLKVAMA